MATGSNPGQEPFMEQPMSDNSAGPEQAADWRQRALLSVAIIALVLAGGLWLYRALNQEPEEAEFSQLQPKDPKPKKNPPQFENVPTPKDFVHAKPKSKRTDRFLDSF